MWDCIDSATFLSLSQSVCVDVVREISPFEPINRGGKPSIEPLFTNNHNNRPQTGRITSHNWMQFGTERETALALCDDCVVTIILNYALHMITAGLFLHRSQFIFVFGLNDIHTQP